MRALLDVLRENRAQDTAGLFRNMAGLFLHILMQSGSGSACLKILDPEIGNEELIKSWEGELAQLRRG